MNSIFKQLEEINNMESIRQSKRKSLKGVKVIAELCKVYEIWQKIKGHENYSISSFGIVRNDKTDKIVNQISNSGGYKFVFLKGDEKNYTKSVHRLLALTFINNPSNKPVVDHIDGVRDNNHINNLRWVTRNENCRNCKHYVTNTSGIKGVTWHKKSNRWRAQISVNDKNIVLGNFKDIQDASKARKEAEIKYFGEFARQIKKD
jgi:hypothetical protein